MRASVTVTPAAAAPNGANMSSINAEWNACETRKSWPAIPSRASRVTTAATAAAGPEITVWAGPFTAAIDTASDTAARTTPSEAATATIAPPAGSACINRPRVATSTAASGPPITPAMHAAAYSPTLCPSTAPGSTPHACHSRANAYSTANNAGWLYSVASRRSAARPHNTSRSGSASEPRSHASQSSIAARNAGAVS